MEKRKKTNRTVLVIIGIIALCVIAWCSWYIWQYAHGNRIADELRNNWEAHEVEVSSEVKLVKIPVDFEALKAVNPEIYAWIYIPGTDISYPVLQHDGDNGYYTRRSAEGEYYTGGCIYSENYNRKDFTDKMTVLYGHNLRSGRMFAHLNDFADVKVFDANRYIYIYTPEKEYIYEIFAAYTHTHEHLLVEHDFNDRAEFAQYFDDVMYSKELNSNFLENGMPDYDTDRVLTLSTCFRGNNQMRYLVQGTLVAEYDAF